MHRSRLIKLAREIAVAQFPQRGRKNGAGRQSQQYSKESEQAAKGQQCKDHRRWVQANALANQARSEEDVLKDLTEAIHQAISKPASVKAMG